MTRFAVPTTVSSRVFIEDDEDEELLRVEDMVRLLLFRSGSLVGRFGGEDRVLGAGEATPRATSWSGDTLVSVPV